MPTARRSRSTRSSSSAQRTPPRPAAGRARARATSSSARCSSRAACWSPARPRIRASSASCRSTTCSPAGYGAAVFGTNLAGEEVLGVRTVRRHRRSPRRRGRPRVRVHAGRRQPRHPPGVRDARACGRRSSPPPATAKPASGAGRAGRAGRPRPTSSGILLAGPNGQGVVSTPARLCAQIVAPYPPAGRIGVASQCGQLRVELHEPRPRHRRRHQPRRVGRQRGRRARRRLPRLLRRRPGDVGRAGVHRGRSPTARR